VTCRSQRLPVPGPGREKTDGTRQKTREKWARLEAQKIHEELTDNHDGISAHLLLFLQVVSRKGPLAIPGYRPGLEKTVGGQVKNLSK
jgi:hypothetical protein